MQITANQHPSEEMIEQYAMGRLDEPAIGIVEEHLLVCHHCQDLLKTTDEFIHAMRMSAQPSSSPVAAANPRWSAETAQPAVAKRPNIFPAILSPKAFQPLFAAGVLTMAALTIAVWTPKSGAEGSAQEVRLEAMRGDTSRSETAQSGRKLRLTLAAPGVKDGEYLVEIADAVGALQRQGAASALNGQLTFETGQPLQPGQYWVRLSHKEAGLLREFSMPVR